MSLARVCLPGELALPWPLCQAEAAGTAPSRGSHGSRTQIILSCFAVRQNFCNLLKKEHRMCMFIFR